MLDLLNFNFFSNIDSNFKDKFAFIKHKMLENNKYIHILGYYDINTKKFKFLDNFENVSYCIIIENDIIFCENLGNISIFYKWNINEDSVEKIFQFNFVVKNFIKVKDKYILNVIIDKNLKKEDYTKNNEDNIDNIKNIKSNCEIIENLPFLTDGIKGYTHNYRTNVFVYDEKNDKLDILLDFKNNYVLNDYENDKILLLEDYYENDILQEVNNIIEIDVNTLEYKYIFKSCENIVKLNISRIFYQNNEIYGFASDMKKHGFFENPSVYKFIDNNARLICKNDFSIANSTGTDVRYFREVVFKKYKNELFFLSTRDYHCDIFKFSNNKITKITDFKGSVENFDFLENKIVFLNVFKDSLQEFYILDMLENNNVFINNLEKISNFNDYKEEILKVEHFSYTSNSDNLDGFVVYPKNFDSSKKYPAILSIHGGPKTVYSDIFFYEMQFFANNGYFVMYTNPHGSCGKDNKFMDIFGEYGVNDYIDFMNFVDETLIRYKNIDENKLAVLGGSYGGLMTNYIISRTDKFKVAVSQRGISNFVSFVGTSDIGYFFAKDQLKIDVNNEKFFEKLWDFSPLKYVDNIKTPTLILHSSDDYRCPLEQALQLFTKLKLNKVKTKLIIYKNENHELLRSGCYESKVRRLKDTINFINENI